jgi:biopolymer transport protein ExbB
MKTRSTLRLVMFAAALLAVIGLGTARALAQAAGASDPADVAPEMPNNFVIVTKLVFGHIDFVTVIIGILSIVSVTFIIRSFMQVREEIIIPEATVSQIRTMIENRQYQELIDFTENDPSFISKAINPALKRAPKYSDMKEAMEIAIGEQTADQFRRIEILNIIGNLGPLLGLLGTVLGMIASFYAMQQAGGNANPSVLAGGIATALAHTFLGLFLAIPNLACFGILRTTADRITTKAAVISEDLLQLMKPSDSASKAAPAPARPQTVVR